jgi:deoxyribodipyrimidine photo-lyase
MKSNNNKISIFWFRRDLRLQDNIGLQKALNGPHPVLPLFIFDSEILDELDNNDARVSFIHDRLNLLNEELKKFSSSLLVLSGKPIEIWQNLMDKHSICKVYANEDYEPYALQRDIEIKEFLGREQIDVNYYKDQVIFAKNDILKPDGKPYTVFTPYKKKWLKNFNAKQTHSRPLQNTSNFIELNYNLPSLAEIGFEKSSIQVKDFQIDELNDYEITRNHPALDQTSYLSPHLRFGTIGIRQVVEKVKENEVFLSELIWREFFMQILFHFPHVVHSNYRDKYNGIEWRNNENEFEKWKNGCTGYPIVDAGMRQLNQTGYMHNRVRMIVASFLCKHLLIDWRWGEAYFAEKLLDYELSSNNGNWQWSAGTGCDAAPYFRVFNPTEQTKKFDSELTYIRKWVPELDSFDYPSPMIDHKFARERAIETYKKGISV